LTGQGRYSVRTRLSTALSRSRMFGSLTLHLCLTVLFCGHAHEMPNVIEIIWSGCVPKPWYVRVMKQNELLRIMTPRHSFSLCNTAHSLHSPLCDHPDALPCVGAFVFSCCSIFAITSGSFVDHHSVLLSNFRNNRSVRSPPLATPGVYDPNVGSKEGHDA
jgi:hypothetical protein